MKYFLFGVVSATCLASSALSAAETIEGVAIKPQVTVADNTLPLNGAGVRVFKFGPFPIKIYVASFYAPTALRSARAVRESPGPLQFNFTFLREVGQSRVTDAWNAQFDASVSFTYDGLAADQKKFVSFFGPLQEGGVETVNLIGNETQVYEGGALKGTIHGADFQRAFLSMWFGEKPVGAELKAGLLGR